MTQKNKELKRAVDELSILNELALAISGSFDSEEIMRTIIADPYALSGLTGRHKPSPKCRSSVLPTY